MRKTENLEVSLSIGISSEDMDDILCTAFEGGITYWCSSVKAKDNKTYGAKYAHEVISKGGIMLLEDMEEDEIYELTKDKLIKGISKFITENFVLSRIVTDNNTIDASMIDAGDADSIVQYALFDEIIYG